LNKDTERKTLLLKEIDKITVNNNPRLERIPGILYSKTGCPEELKHYLSILEPITSKSALGCGLSHIKAWNRIIENNDNCALILEDDAVIDDDFKVKSVEWFKELPKDFDIFFLGCYHGCDFNKEYTAEYSLLRFANLNNIQKVRDVSKNIFTPALPLALHGYILSNNGAKKLIEYFEKDKLNGHVDAQMLKYYKNMNVYALKDKSINQVFVDTNNSNNTLKYPELLNNIVSNIKITSDDTTDLSYKMTIHSYEIFGVGINIWIFICVIVGLLFKNIAALSAVFLTYNIIETVYSKKIRITHLLLFYAISLVGLLIRLNFIN
jgi:GR25 family glycosyltransferase involved in LPS biosynthesis